MQIAHELNMVMNRTDESSLHKQEIAEEQYINHIPVSGPQRSTDPGVMPR